MRAFAQRARGRAELESQIPKFLGEFADGFLEFCFRSIAGVKKQYVDVGIREKPATAETTERHKREIHRTVRFS